MTEPGANSAQSPTDINRSVRRERPYRLSQRQTERDEKLARMRQKIRQNLSRLPSNDRGELDIGRTNFPLPQYAPEVGVREE